MDEEQGDDDDGGDGADGGDGDGENDFYRVFSDQNFTFFELQIFNRFGEPVFQASSPDVSWDGTFNGEHSPIGAYTI